MSDKETQRIRDPVHGLIVFGGGNDAHQNETDRIAWRLLNTREFQRLRRIRQLGFSDLVYPGATHSRLAHAIGVYHTARRLIEVIRRRQDKRHEDKERARVVLLAALLHDIGHGSFSHVFEHAAYSVGLKKRHEDWSADIIQGDTEVNQVLRKVNETSESPTLGSYLDLDDAAVWATLAALAELSSSHPLVSDLARRLRGRRLYKCFDIGIRDNPGDNLYNRFRHKLSEEYTGKYDTLLFDNEEVALYKWSDLMSSPINKVLVKTRAEDQEPRDIADVSSIVSALRRAERIQRIYAPDQTQIEEIRKIWRRSIK